MYIILGILAFGIIIAVHELGHFLTAKAMNVKVLEFSIGMGPKLLSKQGKETLYSLRLIPFGGFCAMEGEYGETLEEDVRKRKDKNKKEIAFTDYVLADGVVPERDFDDDNDENDNSRAPYKTNLPSDEPQVAPEDDPRSFINQKLWKRIAILAAGSLANIASALIIMLLLTLGAEGYIGTTLASVDDRLPELGAAELRPGDKILAINGERLYYYNDYGLFMNLYANDHVTLTIERGDQIVEYTRRSYTVDGDAGNAGEEIYRYALSFNVIEPSFVENIKYAGYQTFNFIRLIRVSVQMMVRGDVGVGEVAGPVRIISTMNDIGRQSPSIMEGIANIIYLTAFIGVNVAVINLLPIPAMDGGRILFSLITWVFEKTTRKKLDPKYENYINTGAFALLIMLMVVIMYNDISQLIRG